MNAIAFAIREQYTKRMRTIATGFFVLLGGGMILAYGADQAMERVDIGADQRRFVLRPSGARFTPWGFNYDHDDRGRLLEDYWEAEWATVEEDFREMKELGANTVRIHLQVGRFMRGTNEADAAALSQLRKLVKLAEREKLYLDVTGLGCYHKKDVPTWYDKLSEEERWGAQAEFWRAVARECKSSPAIFCYDLMNEPVTPPSNGKRSDWLGPPFGGKHFVQAIALEGRGRSRPAIARTWIQQLTRAIRAEDAQHLITVGLVPWSLDRPGLSSGFVPEAIAPDLDFISVHIYPEKGKVAGAIEPLRGFAVGKPVVIEETFPLMCSIDELDQFIEQSRAIAAGWIGFYWGKTLEECRKSTEIKDTLLTQWLDYFRKQKVPTTSSVP
jgi:hypothetical protein